MGGGHKLPSEVKGWNLGMPVSWPERVVCVGWKRQAVGQLHGCISDTASVRTEKGGLPSWTPVYGAVGSAKPMHGRSFF